jgi:hypothetical protein
MIVGLTSRRWARSLALDALLGRMHDGDLDKKLNPSVLWQAEPASSVVPAQQVHSSWNPALRAEVG